MKRLYEEAMGLHWSTGHGSSKDDYKFNPRITTPVAHEKVMEAPNILLSLYSETQ